MYHENKRTYFGNFNSDLTEVCLNVLDDEKIRNPSSE